MNAYTRVVGALMFVALLPWSGSAQQGPPQGPGMQPGPGGMGMGAERKILAQFDKDKNKRLDATERTAGDRKSVV